MARESLYWGLTDEELLERLRDGEESITDFIMVKYKDVVRNKAKAMFILGADRDDLMQEGMIGLFKAIRDYDSGRDASFYTFAELCIARQIYTAIQTARRQKHSPLNTYVSIYATFSEQGCKEGGEEENLLNLLTNGQEENPESMMIAKENCKRLERIMENELSSFEKQVVELYVTGMSYAQIAKVLGRDEKATDNAIQRIKTKMKRFFEEK